MKASTFSGEEVQAVFTVEFLYHDYRRHVENATIKKTVNSDWLLVGLETKKVELGQDEWVETGAIKSYKWEDILACTILDVYEYEGE